MFSRIEHTALSFHIGYIIESVFIQKLCQGDVTTSAFQYEFQALVPSMLVWYRIDNENLSSFAMKPSLCHEIMHLIDSISVSCVSRAQYCYWRTKHGDDCHTIPKASNARFVPNSRAVWKREKGCRHAF